MSQFSFTVEEQPVPGKHTHTWVATNAEDNSVIDLPEGGNGAAFSTYPEIAEYLNNNHGLDISLNYDARTDKVEIEAGGNSTWTFHRKGNVVIIHDIPRTVGRVVVGWQSSV